MATTLTEKSKRSSFDKSYEVFKTANFGEITANCFMLTLPDTLVNFRTRAYVKSRPLVSPVMNDINVHLRNYAVPLSSIWHYWDSWITENRDVYKNLAQRKSTLLNTIDSQIRSLNKNFLPYFTPQLVYQRIKQAYYHSRPFTEVDKFIRSRYSSILLSGGRGALQISEVLFPYVLEDLLRSNIVKSIVHTIGETYGESYFFAVQTPYLCCTTTSPRGVSGGVNVHGNLFVFRCDVKTVEGVNVAEFHQANATTVPYTLNEYRALTYSDVTTPDNLVLAAVCSDLYFGPGSLCESIGINLVNTYPSSVSAGGYCTSFNILSDLKVSFLPLVAIQKAYADFYLPLPTQLHPAEYYSIYQLPTKWYGGSSNVGTDVQNDYQSALSDSLFIYGFDRFLPLFHKPVPLLQNDYFTTTWQVPNRGADKVDTDVNLGIDPTEEQATRRFLGVRLSDGRTDLMDSTGAYRGTYDLTVNNFAFRYANEAMRYIRRGGTDQVKEDFMRHHWDIQQKESALEITYLGANVSSLNVSPVVQTDTTAEAVGASETAKADVILKDNGFVYNTPDYCYIFQLMHLSSNNTYSEGVERQFTTLSAQEWTEMLPEYQGLGDQPVYTSELDGTDDSGTIFGYQNRNQFLKFSFDKCQGNFRAIFSSYMLRPNVDNTNLTPSLNVDWLLSDRERYNNIFSDTSEIYQDFLCDIKHTIFVKTKLSKINKIGY